MYHLLVLQICFVMCVTLLPPPPSDPSSLWDIRHGQGDGCSGVSGGPSVSGDRRLLHVQTQKKVQRAELPLSPALREVLTQQVVHVI